MEKLKRKYSKRTKSERLDRLTARLATLKAAHDTRAKLIEKLEAKVSGSPAHP